MANPAPTINQINAFNATQGTTIDFNIIGGTELVRSNRIYIYDLSDNSLICTHLYVSTESIHELPPNTDSSIVYESGKSSADFVNGAQYYAQIQTFTDIGGTVGGSGLSVAKMFWCLDDPTLTIDTIPSTISITSYNVSATYDANTSVVSNIIQQYQFSLYSATGSLLQSSGVVVGNGEQQGTSTAYDISYNFSGLSVGSSYYVVVDVTTTQGMSVSTQSGTFTVSIDTPTLGEATVVNNACDGYISVTSNLSSEYGGSGSGDIVSFETDSENVFTKLQVAIEPTQSGSGTASPSNVRPIYGVGGVDVDVTGKNLFDESVLLQATGWVVNDGVYSGYAVALYNKFFNNPIPLNCVENEVYTFSCKFKSTNGLTLFFRFHYSDGTRSATQSDSTSETKVTFVSTQGKTLTGISFSYSATDVVYLSECQIEKGSTATTYEPYTESTVSQDFDVSLTPTSKDTDPYLFKAVGDIYGDRLEEDIVGGTVNWNQLVLNPELNNTNNVYSNGGTVTASNGTAIVTAGGTSTTYASFSINKTTQNHVYLVVMDVKLDANNQQTAPANTYFVTNWNSGGARAIASATKGTKKTYIGLLKPSVGDSNRLHVYPFETSGTTPSGDKAELSKPIFRDITEYFGSTTIADYVYTLETGTSGTGIEWLRKYFPLLFVSDANDAGTLKSVNPTAHVTRGVNQWDEEWENGYWDVADGTAKASGVWKRSKNPVPCIQNETYHYTNGGTGSFGAMLYYDADDNYIGYSSSVADMNFTTPSNAHYIRFYVNRNQTDICINISDPTINGQYFPYEKHTYDLGNVPLYGLFQLENNKLKAYGDVRRAEGGTDRKFALYTFDGTETWQYVTWTVSGFRLSGTDFTNKFPNAKVGGMMFITNTKYNPVVGTSWENIADQGNNVIGVLQLNYAGILIRDDSYTSASAFKDSLIGKTIVYELSTTTTEQTDPFEQIQEVSKYGTLEYITTNDVPVGHNTTYYTRDIFGGTLDLVSGRLVVDWVLGDFGDYTWVYNSTRDAFFTSIPNSTWFSGINMISDTYEYLGTISDSAITSASSGQFGCGSYNGIQLKVKNTAYTDATAFKNAMTGSKFVYELATPLTYQLTPQQINTLVGVNNVWSEQGDIELSYHIPITNLLVKRQDVDDVSGNWLTLYSQPIAQASDMDFTFIDFLNQYGKTYKYALVPLLTQTQSGVEVEVEGGYTVSNEVQSIFDGVFISDSTGSQKCKANVGYGNVNMNQSVGSITPIGSQYPIIVTNSNNRYHNGSISGMIVPDDYYYNGNLSRIDMVNKRNELGQFLTNKRAKIIKDWNSNIWLVMIMDNIDCSFDNNYGMGIVTFNANWLEIGDPTSQEDLQATGLVDVGGV